jgi:hypothetical protein
MAKVFELYTKDGNGNDIDRVWYSSTNIKYAECVDPDNGLKTLRVVFNNGTQYEYKDVDVRDYVVFKNDSSQGKALNRLIKEKKYEYEKLENADLEAINEELFFRSGNGFYLENNIEKDYFEIKNSSDESVFKLTKALEPGYFEMVGDILEAVGLTIKKNNN